MKKETRKSVSQVQKEVEKIAKKYAKKEEFKGISNIIYKRVDDLFIFIIFFIRKNKGYFELSVSMEVKLNEYDNLFWKIFKMESNISERESLRANGAFACPSVEIQEKTYKITEENYEEVTILAVEEFYQILNVFLENLKRNYIDFNDYVLKQEDILNDKLLKMLANISIHKILDAKQMVTEEIKLGNRGGYGNEGLDIYEHILNYCNKLLKEK